MSFITLKAATGITKTCNPYTDAMAHNKQDTLQQVLMLQKLGNVTSTLQCVKHGV